MSIPLASSPLCSSQIATHTAAATMNMNAGFQKNSDSPIATSSTTAEPMAALRSRPARPWSLADARAVSVMRSGFRTASYLDELGFLVLEHLVDRVGVLLGDAVESLLGAGDVVLADLAILLELLQAVLGGTPQVADRDPAVLGLGARDLDVLLAALLGELGEDAAQHLAVVGGVH